MATPSDVILRDTRAAQPTPSAYAAGILYYVTDEATLERWSGIAWESVEGAGAGGDPYTEGARVYNNANISIPNITWTNLTFNTELYDTDTIHATGSNTERLTCKTAGKYLITGLACWATDATYDRRIAINLNAGTQIGFVSQAPAPNIPTVQNVISIYELSVGNYVTLEAYQNTGGALNVLYAGVYSPQFMMQRIG